MFWKSIVNTVTRAWHLFKAFGERVASIVNFILLIPVYFIGVGLTKIIVIVFRIEVLNLQQNREEKSYWKEYACKTEAKERYKRMF